MKILFVAFCALILCNDAFSDEPEDVPRAALEKFWKQSAGKTIRRLPVRSAGRR